MTSRSAVGKRSLGIGVFLIPIVSIAAATTLLPALLSLYGRRGSARLRIASRRPRGSGLWHALAHAIMRRPLVFLACGTTALLLAAAPVFLLRLTPGSVDGVPDTLPSVRGFHILSDALGAGALSPTQIVVDTRRPRGVTAPQDHAATLRLAVESALGAGPEAVVGE